MTPPAEVRIPVRPRDAAGDIPAALRDEQPARSRAPTPSDNPPADDTGASQQPGAVRDAGVREWLRRHSIAAAIGVVLFLAAAAAGYIYWDYARHFESTDDAFIESRQFIVAPKVAGYIIAVPVTDNQHVNAGDVLARIDDRDYRIAVDQAQAQVSAAQANIKNIDAQITIQQAQINAGQAQVEQAQAALTYAEQQAQRYADLAQREAGTVQMAQQTASTLRQDQAALRNAQASLAVAQRQVDALKAQRTSAEASLAQANAQLAQAKLNLSYTTIRAAQAGRIADLTAAAGQFAQPGTALAMFVPDEIWVTANYKETQLTDMRPGQPATMRIDAYPGRLIRGHVDSVQSGSGTAFSLLPAQNATGNYVKIVQRVPVKIIMDDAPSDVALGPGMSVVPSVRVLPGRSLYERIAALL